MNTYLTSLITAFLLLCFVYDLAAQTPGRDPAQEMPIVEQLRNISPKSVDNFIAATELMDNGQFAEAEKLYAKILSEAPDFEPALRRQGYTYIALGRRAEGLELTKKALDKNRSVENLVGRASSLLTSNDPNFRPSFNETSEAMALAREAWQKSGETDEDAGGILAEILLQTDQNTEFEKLVPKLTATFPNSAMAAYYNAIYLGNRGDFDGAEGELKRSVSLGATAEFTHPLFAAIEKARDEAYFGFGRYIFVVRWTGYLIVAWIIGLVAIFFIGRTLSTKTLKAIENSDPNDIKGVEHAGLRRTYRKIIATAGVYYYVSQPFVIILIIGAIVFATLFFLWVGLIPIKLLAIFAIGAIVSIFYILKSLGTRVKAEDPGRALHESEAPGLWKLVRDVASTLDTRPVDEIRITPGTDLAVYERGGFRAKLSDKAERVLILGVAVLNDFQQNSFRAVLAHEYGHFSNRDTAGGEIALRVNTDIIRTAEASVGSGNATYYNVGFHFLRLFHFLFRRITHGATRLQEVLADRVAAYHFGTEAFEGGLTHVIRREVTFQKTAEREINSAMTASRPFANLYKLEVSDDSERDEIELKYNEFLSQPTTEDDTHPAPADRFRYISGIRSREHDKLDGQVLSLFVDSEAIFAEMNKLIEGSSRPTYDTSASSTLGI